MRTLNISLICIAFFSFASAALPLPQPEMSFLDSEGTLERLTRFSQKLTHLRDAVSKVLESSNQLAAEDKIVIVERFVLFAYHLTADEVSDEPFSFNPDEKKKLCIGLFLRYYQFRLDIEYLIIEYNKQIMYTKSRPCDDSLITIGNGVIKVLDALQKGFDALKSIKIGDCRKGSIVTFLSRSQQLQLFDESLIFSIHMHLFLHAIKTIDTSYHKFFDKFHLIKNIENFLQTQELWRESLSISITDELQAS